MAVRRPNQAVKRPITNASPAFTPLAMPPPTPPETLREEQAAPAPAPVPVPTPEAAPAPVPSAYAQATAPPTTQDFATAPIPTETLHEFDESLSRPQAPQLHLLVDAVNLLRAHPLPLEHPLTEAFREALPQPPSEEYSRDFDVTGELRDLLRVSRKMLDRVFDPSGRLQSGYDLKDAKEVQANYIRLLELLRRFHDEAAHTDRLRATERAVVAAVRTLAPQAQESFKQTLAQALEQELP